MKSFFVAFLTLCACSVAQADVSFNELRGQPRGPIALDDTFSMQYAVIDPGANVRCISYGMPNGGGFNFPYFVRAKDAVEAIHRVNFLMEKSYGPDRLINFEIKNYEVICEEPGVPVS